MTCSCVGTLDVVKIRLRMFVTSAGVLYGSFLHHYVVYDLWQHPVSSRRVISPETVFDCNNAQAFAADVSAMQEGATCSSLILGGMAKGAVSTNYW